MRGSLPEMIPSQIPFCVSNAPSVKGSWSAKVQTLDGAFIDGPLRPRNHGKVAEVFRGLF